MQSILTSTHRFLSRNSAPALPLTELHRALRRERTGPVPSPPRLLDRLRARPDLFRIVEPWRGPWAPLHVPGSPYPRRLAEADLELEPWVAPKRGSPEAFPDSPKHPTGRIDASLGHLGRFLGRRPPRARLRWLGMARQSRRAAPHLNPSLPVSRRRRDPLRRRVGRRAFAGRRGRSNPHPRPGPSL